MHTKGNLFSNFLGVWVYILYFVFDPIPEFVVKKILHWPTFFQQFMILRESDLRENVFTVSKFYLFLFFLIGATPSRFVLPPPRIVDPSPLHHDRLPAAVVLQFSHGALPDVEVPLSFLNSWLLNGAKQSECLRGCCCFFFLPSPPFVRLWSHIQMLQLSKKIRFYSF